MYSYRYSIDPILFYSIKTKLFFQEVLQHGVGHSGPGQSIYPMNGESSNEKLLLNPALVIRRI
jgi:hypothetical protein